MRKLRIEELAVESFATNASGSARGTVMGHADTVFGWTCNETCAGNDTCGAECDDFTVAPQHTCIDGCWATYGPEKTCIPQQ